MIVGGIAIYFLSQSPNIFRGSPQEKISTPAISYTPPSVPTTLPQTEISSPSTQIPDYLIPSGFTRNQLSLYFQKITISSAYTSFFGSYPSEIKLYSSLPKDEEINITGWRLKSNHGEIIIPQAVDIYEPSGLAPEEDIVISGNSSVSIYSSKSPINRNFRINKCIGHLENTYNFNPTLPQSCPSIPRSEIAYLSGQCQSYILSLWGCKLPDVSFYNSLPGNDEGNACRAFLSTINWNSCFQKHYADLDFLSNEWRIWINQNILDSQHDTVRLFDAQGLLVYEDRY